MITYQDMLAVGQSDIEKADFVLRAINDHKNSELYKTAETADTYYRCKNKTTMEYQRTYTTVEGAVVPDNYTATHRTCSNYFNLFVTQLVQYLLGNGAKWSKDETAGKLGNDFDNRLQDMGKAARCGGVAFGFFNLDHLEVFPVLEFVPIYDEENGAMMAGVRFWQIDSNRPMRATLYEMDGYTNYLWNYGERQMLNNDSWQGIGKNCYMQAKRPYVLAVRESEADGETIYNGMNYPTFPIVPMWGNPLHQSEIVGLQEKIDAYDFIMNGFEDDLDNAQIYWMIKGAGGMEDEELMQFLDRLRTVKAAAPGDEQDVAPVQVDIPYAARETLLDRIEKQLYRDAMIMNPDDIASGATTATQIRAAYERQNVNADQFEYCVLDFLNGILKVAGIEDNATFTRSTVINVQEEINTVVAAASYLSEDYVTEKILTILGDGDKAKEIIRQKDADGFERMNIAPNTENQANEKAIPAA